MRRSFEIIGAPFGFAANTCGSNNAPSYLRQHGLNTRIRQRIRSWDENIKDVGDILVENEMKELLEEKNIIKAVELYCYKLHQCVLNSYICGNTPIIIGGDHSISIGTISATASYLTSYLNLKNLGILWVDAHADLNYLDKGNIHGKSAAIALGYGNESLIKMAGVSPMIKPENLIYIGIRDLMPNEDIIMKSNKIQLYGMDKIDELGIHRVIKEAVKKLEDSTDGFFVSFDIDACDGGLYQGCSTPEAGGLTAREAIQIAYWAGKSSKLLGADIVEFSPEDDRLGNTGPLVIKLIDAILGYRM